MQKYVIVKLLESLPEGAEFPASHWPLHVTLVANFTLNWELSKLYERLSGVVTRQHPIEITAGGDEYFGPNGNTKVTVLNMTDELRNFHNALVDILKNAGAVFDEPRYMNQGYRAHATVQRSIRLNEGDAVGIDELTIVDMFPNEDINQRKILHTIKFSAE